MYRRKLYISVLALGLLVACGDDDEKASNNGGWLNNDNNGTTNNGTNTGTNNGTTGTNNGTTVGGPECHLLEYDSDGDDVTNAIQIVEYDAAGNERVVELDLGADGSIENTETREFDAAGQMVRQEKAGADGVVFEVTTQEYDDAGHVISHQRDADNDGNPDYVIEATYDADGNTLTYKIDGRLNAQGGVSESANGTWNLDLAGTWDGPNKPVHVTVDTDGDGMPNMDARWTYDNAGSLLEYRTDGLYDFDTAVLIESADGTDDIVTTNTFMNGQLVRMEEDGYLADGNLTKADGTADIVTTDIEFDSMGRVTRMVVDGRRDRAQTIVEPANGTPTGRYTFEYGTANEWTTLSWDELANGTEDLVLTRTLDAENRPLRTEFDGEADETNNITEVADGTPNRVEVRTYDAAGELTSLNVDDGNNGQNEVTLESERNAAGAPTVYRVDGELDPKFFYFVLSVADGVWDTETALTYDENNRTLTYEVREDGTKTVGGTWVYGACTEIRGE